MLSWIMSDYIRSYYATLDCIIVYLVYLVMLYDTVHCPAL